MGPTADSVQPGGDMARRAALYGLIVIFLANFLNYMDRQLVSALEKPISQELLDPRYAKYQFGLLWTLFTVGYMICATPIGLMADRFSRTKLFAACVFIWSVATIASGAAMSREVLYVSRVFIGIGEAGCLVIGPSIISDLFSREVRGRALSLFYLGMPLGGTAAFILAGLLLDIGWRNLFFLAGAPGFAVAVLIWMMRDPPRGGTESGHGASNESNQHGHGGGGGLKQYGQLFKNPTLLLIILAQACAAFILIPLIHFGTEFFVESRGMGDREARLALGIMALVAGGLGNSLSGFLGDRLARYTKGAYALLAGIGFLLGWPCLLVGFQAEDRWVFLPALTLGSFFYFLCMPAVNTQIANVVSPTQRATAWALAIFILHFLGDALSPPLFGSVSHEIGTERAFVYFSTALAAAGICCLIAARTARRDVERVLQGMEDREAAPPAS